MSKTARKHIYFVITLLLLAAFMVTAQAENGTQTSPDSMPEAGTDFTINSQSWCYPNGYPVTDGSVAGMSKATWAYNLGLNGAGWNICSMACGDDTINYVYSGTRLGWIGFQQPGANGQWEFTGDSDSMYVYVENPNEGSSGSVQTCPEWSVEGD